MTWNRRRFLTAFGGASLAWPSALTALRRTIEAGGAADDEPFWDFVRGQFTIPDGRVYLNNGTLGPPPRVVVDAVAEHARRVASTFPPAVDWDDAKRSIADLLGGDPDGYVFPRNTTEAMSFVANGLDLPLGATVVTTDHEHIGGYEPWRMITKRRGGEVIRAPLAPPTGAGSGDVVNSIWDRVDDRTAVVVVSHMTFTTGSLLPVHQLGELCRERGIVFVVDGAHPPGMLSVDVGAEQWDFYCSSPHKWLLAPQGTGLLYLREPWRSQLWPTVASGGWDDEAMGAHRLNHLGTVDESRIAGLLAAVGFVGALRMDRVEARVRFLRDRLERGLRGLRGVEVVTPEEEAKKGGIVSFSMEGVESLALQRHLSRAANVRSRVISEYEYGWMRLSTHVYNSPGEVDFVLEVLNEVSRNGIPT